MSEKSDVLSRSYDRQSAAEVCTGYEYFGCLLTFMKVKEWISSVLGESLPDSDLIDILQDGVILCR